MSFGDPRILPPALLEDDDLLAARLLQHGGGHRGAGHGRRANRHIVAVTDHQNLIQGNLGACLGRQLFHLNDVVRRDFVLFSAGFDHCEHGAYPKAKGAATSQPREVAEYTVGADSVNRKGGARAAFTSGPREPAE